MSGTYTILVDPNWDTTGAVTLTLSEEVLGWITPGGASVPVTIARAGQRARLFFNGTAGQRVSINVIGATFTSYNVLLLNPNGSTLANTGGQQFLEPQTLPSTDVYAVLLDPYQAYTGSGTVIVYDVPPDITGSLTINGAALPVTLSVGQKAFLTVAATAGQWITLRGTNSTIGCLEFAFYLPTGGWVSGACGATWQQVTYVSQTGTYTFRLDPYGAYAGSLDVSVTSP